MSQTSHKHVRHYQSMKRNGVHPDTAVYFVELEAKMDNIAAQMATKTEVSNLRESMTREFAAVRGEISKVREDVMKSINHQTWTLVGVMLAIAAVLVVVPRLWP